MARIMSGWCRALNGGLGLLVVGCTVPIDLVDETGSGTAGGTDAPMDEGTSGTQGASDGGSESDDSGSDDSGSGDSGAASVCGNAMMEPGEDCDDGNQTDADGCNSDCRISGSLSWSLGVGTDKYTSSANLVAIDSEDQIAVAGEDSTFILDTLGWVAKVEAAGQLSWIEMPGDCAATRSLAAGPLDQLVHYGCIRNTKTNPFVVFTLDADGSLVESPLTPPSVPDAIAVAPEGTIFVVAGAELIAYADAETWSWDLPSWGPAAAVTPDGGLAVTTNVSPEPGTPGTDSSVLLFDDLSGPGEPAWTATGPVGHMLDVASDPEGNIIVLGRFKEAKDNPQEFPWLLKLAPDGTELWSTMLDIDTQGSLPAVAIDSMSRIVVAGRLPVPAAWITKYDPDGAPLWTTTLEGASCADVAINSVDEIVVAGTNEARGWVAAFAP